MNKSYSHHWLSHDTCFKLNLLAIFCTFLFLLSVFFNSLLLCLFFVDRKLRTSVNWFVISLTVLNLLGTFAEVPFIILNNFFCRLVFSVNRCIFSAFVMYFVGSSGVYLLCASSYERLYIIQNGTGNRRRMSNRFYLITILACLLCGLFWSSMPLLGWSYYALVGVQTSCSVKWNERTTSVISYNICIFIFVFIIPFIFIIATNSKLLYIIITWRKRCQKTFTNCYYSRKMMAERRVTLSVVVLIFGFIVSWLPYALVSMYSAFIDHSFAVEISGTLPSIFAKTSMVWTTVLYMLANENMRKRLCKCKGAA